ncbi:MAG TPA: hypothetical protein VM869_29955 [Enhygromyxa sp.]|nr:hypothetical protein [Enhygromyxa sp.]
MKHRASWLAAFACTFACVDVRPPASWAEPAEQPDPQASAAAEAAHARVDADAFGVGWLERDGVFSSYSERVRVRRLPGWSLLVDDLVTLGLPDAGSGIYHAELDLAIFFILDRHVDESPEAYRALRLERTLGFYKPELPEPPMTATFAGRELSFDALSGGPLDMSYLFAAHFVDADQALQIVAWHPRTGDREALREHIREALAQVELMSADEVEAVRAELARGPDVQNQVGATWSLRRGVFREFDRDFVWTSPSRDWVVHAGRLADRYEHGATLVLRNRMERLVGALKVYADPRLRERDGVEFHEFVLGEMIEAGASLEGPRRRLTIGPGEALVQTVTLKVSGLSASYELATIKHGAIALVWFIGGPERHAAASRASIDAVIVNTRVEAGLVDARTDGSRFRDLRLGYSLELPPGYRRKLREHSELDPRIETAAWGTDDGAPTITVITLAWAASGDTREEVLELSKRYFVEQLGPPTQTRSATLDGERGEHLHWDAGDVLIVSRDWTMVALLVDSGTTELFERVRESFAFVD